MLVPIAAVLRPDSFLFLFIIIGDRTGEAQPGVYEQVWQEAAAERPAFVVSVGDTIEGLNDATAATQWSMVEQLLTPYRRYPLYFAPGNHDIWSESSERLFRKYARHEPHYAFDYGQAHFTILDNSRSDEFSAGELDFLEKELRAHAAQPVKFIVSHRPSWLMHVVLADRNFAVHQLAKKYGAQYVIAGHIHEMLHVDLDGVTYASMASSGGHLRASRKYEDGWFFGYTLVEVRGKNVRFLIKELRPPHGGGRMTRLDDWGVAGLVNKGKAAPFAEESERIRKVAEEDIARIKAELAQLSGSCTAPKK